MSSLLDRRTLALWLAAFLVLAIAGCAGGLGSGASSTPGPQPSTCSVIATAAPSRPPKGGCSGEAFTASELRLLLIDELGPLWYCDRDSYPVGRDELEGMKATWPELVADHELADAARERIELPPFDDPGWTDDERLEVYRLWKMATAVALQDIGNGRFRFDYLAQPAEGQAEGTRTSGIVDTHGAITVEQQAAAGEPMCPICLDRLTTIDTPAGPVEVDRLRLGDEIWTLDANGARVTGTVIALGSVPAPAGHRVIHLALSDGRSVSASAGHPLADGRTLGELRVGDAVDGSTVASVDSVAYEGGETFDLVVSGATGTYFAGAIALGSTID